MIYYDMAGLAKMSGVSRQEIYYLVKNRKLNHTSTANYSKPKVLFTRHQVAEALERLEEVKEKGANRK